MSTEVLAFSADGSVMTPCGCSSPHHPHLVRRRPTELYAQVLCNRPSGHEGNHMWSDGRLARIAEWTRSGEVIR